MDPKINQRKELFSKRFKAFCEKGFGKELKELEKTRHWYIKSIYAVGTIGTIITGFLTFLLTSAFTSFDSDSIKLVVIVAALFMTICKGIEKAYKNKAKKIVLDKLLSFIGNIKNVKLSNAEKQEEIKYFKSIKLFDKFDNCEFDDCFNGEYKGLKVEIRELNITKTSGKETITIFKGIYIRTPSLKNFNGFITISAGKKDGNVVKLEDPTFENHYKVYSNDQIEARYILTTSFMERLLRLKDKKISMTFENGYIHIGSATKEDMFEMSLKKPATEISNYRGILLQLLTLLSIIDTLKLEQNIGL